MNVARCRRSVNLSAGAGTFAIPSGIPERLTIDFQTGIAPNTLLFGSIQRALWSNAHIFMFDWPHNCWQPAVLHHGTIKTTHDKLATLYVGLGRKLSDKWAVSAS